MQKTVLVRSTSADNMLKYLKIRLKDQAVGNGAKTILLEVLADKPDYILGYKVNLRGDAVECTPNHEVKQLIMRDAIKWTKEMELDKFYGMLEEVKHGDTTE